MFKHVRYGLLAVALAAVPSSMALAQAGGGTASAAGGGGGPAGSSGGGGGGGAGVGPVSKAPAGSGAVSGLGRNPANQPSSQSFNDANPSSGASIAHGPSRP